MTRTTDRCFRRRPGRSAFTLIELLVVIGIALIIISLTAAAAIQVLAYQRASNTQNTLKTLSDSLDRQWRIVVDKATKESQGINSTTNPGIYWLASQGTGNFASVVNQNIDKRARVIYVKLRLKQEFPMNFSEALYPWALPPSLYKLPAPMTPPLSVTELPPLPSYGNTPGPPFFTPYSLANLPKGIFRIAKIYVPAFTEPPGIYPAGFNPGFSPYPASTDPYSWPIESSACVLKALQQGREGPALTEDSLGSGALQSFPGMDPNAGIKIIVDAWQQPILFYRWPAPTPYTVDGANDPNNLNNRDLDNSDPVGLYNATAPKTVFRDPLDPEGVLLDPDWNNQANFVGGKGVWWFELYCHSVHEWFPGQPNYQPRAYYGVPTFVSAGRNGKLGLVQPPIGGGPPPYPAVLPPLGFTPYWSPLLPDPMDIDRAFPQDANDNIYSYRLRQGARGD